jgi:uncharacterized delta-60 repeat protein
MRAVLVAIGLAWLAAGTAAAGPGDLDGSFGTGGIVRVPGSAVDGLALQPDGRILAGIEDATGAAIVRFDADGRPDESFARIAGAGFFALDADGGVLTTAMQCDGVGFTGCDVGLTRFDRDGRRDRRFDLDAVHVAPMPVDVSRVVRMPDGRVLIGGAAGHAPSFVVWVARFAADGERDRSFGTDGVVLRDVSSHGASLGGLVVLGDGTIVIGATGAAPESAFGELFPLTAGGVPLDAVAPPFVLPALALGPGGALLAAGSVRRDVEPITSVALARFTAALEVDAGFGGGLVSGPPGFVSDLAVGSSGAVVVAGAVGPFRAERFAVLRFTADGAPDDGFGGDGIVTLFPDETSIAERLAIQPDGKLLVGGVDGSTVSGTAVVLVRFGDAGSTTVTPGATTSTGGSTSSTSTTLPACLADGFDGLACRCATVPACGAPRVPAARLARACALVTRAGDASPRRSVRLLRRAAYLFAGIDRRMHHAMQRPHAGACAAELASRAGDLERTARALLDELR